MLAAPPVLVDSSPEAPGPHSRPTALIGADTPREFAVAGGANEIVIENALPGNPPAEWEISGAGDSTIQGFGTDISVDQGQTIGFKFDTDSDDYHIDIYRLGWYGGLGARKVATILPSASLPQIQPACLEDLPTGLVDCGNWSISAEWEVPVDAVSGVYIARPVRADTQGASHIVFIVRDDDGESDILVQTCDTTWQAYNSYGGNSLYVGSPAGRAYRVSYNRPFNSRAGTPEDWVFNADFPLIRWLEANGYDASYCSGVDSHRSGAEILEHPVFISIGHDEYWSGDQRTNVEAARDAGVSLCFFSGNEVFWKTRYEPSIDGSATPNRTLTCYKETHAGAKIDPLPDVWTGTWRDPRFSPPADGGRPENSLTGTIFTVNCCTYELSVSGAHGRMRLWANTGLDLLDPEETAIVGSQIVGYEWDEALINGATPPGLVRLSKTTVAVPQRILDHGSSYGPGIATHNLSLHRAPSGALVFGAGTVQWAWGLDSTHDRGPAPSDIRIQQATVNLLADMGVQPEALQPGLVAAIQSTDTIPPAATIDDPLAGEVFPVGSAVTVSGAAVDSGGGVVGAVEVSFDNGATWLPANGLESWSISWVPAAAGEHMLRVRATDDSANLSAASSATSVTVVESEECLISFWTDSDTPALPSVTDGTGIELGVRFRSDNAGSAVGVRFYKSPDATGTHIGNLWTAAGALLATVTFVDETPSGWQEATFDSPVELEANTTYVVSYHSPSGFFAITHNDLAAGRVNLPLRIPDNTSPFAPNAVYLYTGATAFPANSGGQGHNYWVDIVFDRCAEPPPPPPGNEHVIWEDPGEPAPDANDNGAVELGVKFRASVDGFIKGVRFYKHAANTGTHVGSLWTSGGALLDQATFTSETASGWQRVDFDQPVPITANTTYIASYYAPSGHYAFTAFYFNAAFENAPLRALASGEDGGNGVFTYGPSPVFPTSTFNAANYWVDVVFVTDAGPDMTPPTVLTVAPPDEATNVDRASPVVTVFNESLDPLSIAPDSVILLDGSLAPVPASIAYHDPTRTVTLSPAALLNYGEVYTAILRGGASPPHITDAAGNPLAADHVWTFSTVPPPPPPPDTGFGGPILVLGSAGNKFGRYPAEILRAEGFTAFSVADIEDVDADFIDGYDLIVLGQTPLSPGQATMLTDWVNDGGQLIALRPDPQLAPTLGLTYTFGFLNDLYMRVEPFDPPGHGITPLALQYHSRADLYLQDDATIIAWLRIAHYQDTGFPAASIRDVGPNGGRAACFTFDLARCVIYMRQGNPAWAGQERDGFSPLRSGDMFYGPAGFDPRDNWIDFDRVHIPQADELQRLFANLVMHMMETKRPMPRFWYFPSGHRAVVVMTGDDHANGGTIGRFNQYISLSPPGCSVPDWECIRSTSYIYPSTPMSDPQAAAFHAAGFEVALHPLPTCANQSAASYDAGLAADLAAFALAFPSIPSPATNRSHCVVWSEWAAPPNAEVANGIRLDTNYYYWPPGWINNLPGMFTGSGMPMRFADTDGRMIDCYQVATQMTDESGQTYPFTVENLLDRALGQEGYFGAFCANMHTDSASHAGSDAIVAAAQARSVPIVSARQMLDWIDGRNGSRTENIEWNEGAGELIFDLIPDIRARNLEVMIPRYVGPRRLVSVSVGALRSGFTLRAVKGIEYGVFPASSDSVTALYAVPPPCLGDANYDGVVNFLDILAILANWGSSGGGDGLGDADHNGIVNFDDVTTVLANWGVICA